MSDTNWEGTSAAPGRKIPRGRDRQWSGRTLWLVCAAGAALTLLVGLFVVTSDSPRTVRPADSPPSIGTVQTLYSQDLLARVNAERAARNSATQPVPPLAVDPGLAATAQSWSAYLASTGVVQDPALTACGPDPTPGQVCELAANSGDSGNGYWPGDGSDGMDNAYMASAGHRQNMLDAGYNEVGIGVTCSGGQAWTVELFGLAYDGIGPAQSREAAQHAVAGDPVPAVPTVAGTQTGDPVYCPGQTVGPDGRTTSTGGQYPYPYPVPSVAGEPVAAPTAVGIAAAAGDRGYWVAKSDGSVKALGAATNLGSMAGQALAFPVVQIVSTPDGNGYWLVGSDGGVFSFGDAAFYGSTGGLHLNAPIVDLAPTPDGRGYWEVGADGGIFAFGDAAFYGSTGALHLNAPIVGMAAAPDGSGYWLVGSDGGVFSFGDATFHGSTGGLDLNAPIVDMAAAPDGGGYWLVGSDGGIFAFGDAPFQGSAGSFALQAPITGIAADASTGGYWLAGTDGGVFAFAAPFDGAG
jgi:hypothetical protein